MTEDPKDDELSPQADSELPEAPAEAEAITTVPITRGESERFLGAASLRTTRSRSCIRARTTSDGHRGLLALTS